MPGATSNSSENHPSGGVAAGRGELIAKLGTVVSAVMASSCCWLPVLLLAVGVSGAGIASTLEAYRPFFMTVTFGFLAMAFYFTYRPQIAGWGQAAPAAGNRRRFTMMTLNKGMLWAVTLMAVVFLFFPQYMTGLVGGAGETLTADMTHSVLQVEGMTCKG